MAEPMRTVVTDAEIATRVRELAAEISAAYEGEQPTMLGLLDDCFVFLADLIRQINQPLACSFIHAITHQSGGHIDITYTTEIPVSGRHILLVGGVLDTGVTVDYVMRQIQGHGAKSVRLCVLLDKPDFRNTEVTADFVGFRRSEPMVFGYGLGIRDNYRYLPHLAVLDE